ncbi:uncharacterized protein [Littorina saxatilis]|uniref:uncharacterized protein isoform X2 n=1 Tax=Littorina saxatilis TaxID=31220 RepID=UPI0038B47781
MATFGGLRFQLLGRRGQFVICVGLTCFLCLLFFREHPLTFSSQAAFGDQLDPNKLMEWFEVQRLLGVDHIQIMDADNPEPVQKVFRYYKDMGLLNPLPYELPGKPYGRGLDLKRFVKDQGDHDKSFPILECTQRLKGYSYVMGIDMDEVLVPVHHHNIKDFANHKFMKNPDAAGFFFYTQFFVYDWGPTNTKSNISILRYLNSTLPKNECKKYIYLTSRVFQTRTHTYDPKPGFQRYWVDTDEAVLHHYRMCPKNVWPTCYPEKMTDASLMRLQSQLEKRIEIAREATGIRPPTA